MTDGKEWTREELQGILKEYKAITVPVQIRIEGKHQVIATGDAEELIDRARRLALRECDCRKRVKGCDRPLDVCIGIDDDADDYIDKGTGWEITKTEAKRTVAKGHNAGLVLMSFAFDYDGKSKTTVLCNCCSCCCHSLSALTRFGFSDAVASSRKVSMQDDEKCNNCGLCVDRCQFKARVMIDERLSYLKEKCSGCGVCADSCPALAISLADR